MSRHRRLPDGQVKAFYVEGRHVEGLSWYAERHGYKSLSQAVRAVLDLVCTMAEEGGALPKRERTAQTILREICALADEAKRSLHECQDGRTGTPQGGPKERPSPP